MKEYSEKKAEWRKIYLVNKFIPKCRKLLDLACGPGEYGPFLKQKCKFLVGLDIDKKLLKIAKKRGYDKLICKKIKTTLPFKTEEFDAVWCSEFLEHLSDLRIIDEIERITKKVIIITLPNPSSPHFKEDKTHILNYNIGILKKFFKNRNGWNYKIRGLGFDDLPFPLLLRKMTTFVLYFLPEFSPTISIIGNKNKYNSAKN